MNCEECKAQVLELIEREAIDPEGVREILACCPDCRAEFEAMKAALALVAALPLEEPRPLVEAAILRAAAARANLRPARKRPLQAPPWAMAAIALLAVGVGVWTIPREVEHDSERAPAQVEPSQAPQLAEATLDDELVADARMAQVEVAPVLPSRGAALEGSTGTAKKAARKPARAGQRAQTHSDEPRENSLAKTPPEKETAGVAGGAPATVTSDAALEEADSAAAFARNEAASHEDRPESCRRKIADFQRRQRDDPRYSPKPEETLELGRCYARLDDVEAARLWLRRAAAEPETKRRAKRALRELSTE